MSTSMLNIKRRQVCLLMGCAVIAAGSLLTGCHKDEPQPNAPGYYDGPMEGKGKAKAATEDATKKGTTP